MENFVVSARKFRPLTFASVVGQNHITQTLKNAIARNQLAHAYLFTGPRGVGKTSCARIFAKAINCLSPLPDHEACGECESCIAFSKDRSFNIHELDAASNNSVDDMRALTDKVRIAPQIGKYSIYIIDEVHMLSTAAFNAFLKTLEEPPAYAIFILATTEKHKILPTILSRCQIYDFNRIRVEDMVEYLKYIAAQQGVAYDEESLHIIALKADGGMRDALSTFDRVVSFCGNNLTASVVAESIGALELTTYFRAVELALHEDFSELLLLLDSVLKKGFDAQIFIAGLCEHLRDLVVTKNPQTATLLETTEAIRAQYSAQAAQAEYEFLFNGINLLTQADTTYKQATNRRLHAELAMIKLSALKKKEPIAERYPMPAITVTRSTGGEAEVTSVPIADRSADQGTDRGAINGVDSATAAVAPKASSSASLSSDGSSVDSATAVVAPKASSSASLSTDGSSVDSPSSVTSSQTASGTTASNPAVSGPTVASPATLNIGESSFESPNSAAHNSAAPNVAPNSAAPNATALSPAVRRSITGIEIKPKTSTSVAVPSIAEPVSVHTPEESERIIRGNYAQLIDIWRRKSRPRIASALEVCKFNGSNVTIAVPDQVQQDEMNQAKLEIERDFKTLTNGIAVNFEFVIEFVEHAIRPITVEQKYQHLVDINPDILKLHKRLDLTVL